MVPPRVTRRQLLGRSAAAAGLCGFLPPSLFRLFSSMTPMPRITQEWGGIVLQRDEGQLLISGRRRAPMRVKVDSAGAKGVRMSMVVSEVAPGSAIPVHRHRNEDELIFIHAGKGIVTLGEGTTPVSTGAMLYGPRGIWHGVENTGSEPLTWCAIFSPAGFEQYFKEIGVAPGDERRLPTAEQVNTIAKKYGLEFRDA